MESFENSNEIPVEPEPSVEVPEADSSVPEPSSETDDIQSDVDFQIEQAVHSLSQIDGLDPKTWQTLDANERYAVLQDIENQMASIQGRPSVEITLDQTLSSTTFGGWDGQQIRINAAHIDSGMPVDEFIDTMVHEGRHAYQDYAVENLGFDNDQALVDSWGENNKKDHYLDPNKYGQELYQSQPVEADAWDYGSRIRNALIVANWR